MLEAIRRSSRSTIIYVLFAVLIAVFVINFGPGSRGCGAELTSSYAARVAGSTISDQEYRLSYIALGGPNIPPQFAKERRLKEFVMDKLIERELLAQEAERLGFAVSEKEVEDMAAEGKMYILGVPRRADELFVDGHFSYDRLKAVCQNRLGVSVARFIEVQRREMLADKVKQLLLGGIRVTPDEVKADYDQKETQASLVYVRFQPRQFEDKVTLTPEEIAAWQAAHKDEIQKQYEEHAFLYKKQDKQARLARILVKIPEGAPEGDPAAWKTQDDKFLKVKAKIERAGRRIKAGEDFAVVAKAMSEDDATKDKGGEAGWKKKAQAQLGADNEAQVFTDAKEGDVVGPVRTDRGLEVIKVEGFREGDLPLDAVASEIAEEKLRQERAKVRARDAATEAIAGVRDGQSLSEQFPKPTDTDESNPLKKLMGPPVADETGPFARHGELIPQVGVSADLMKKAFELKAGEVAGPFEVGGGFVVASLKERKEPDKEFFEKHKDEEVRQFTRQKWADVLDAWTKQRCIEVRDDGRLKVTDDVLTYEGMEKGEVKYTPCAPTKL